MQVTKCSWLSGHDVISVFKIEPADARDRVPPGRLSVKKVWFVTIILSSEMNHSYYPNLAARTMRSIVFITVL